MERIFIYKRKSSTTFWPALIFAIIAVVCYVFKHGIAFKRLTLLSYPNSVIVTAIIAVLFAVWYVFELRKERHSKANPDTIKVDDLGVKFTTPKKSFTFAYSEVECVRRKKEDGDNLIIVSIRNKNRQEWKDECFASAAEFEDFASILNERCAHSGNN